MDDILTKIFGDQLPKESFLEKTHPIGKLITMLFFPIMAFCFYGTHYNFIILFFYLLLLSLNHQNPFKPWFVWLFVFLISFVVYNFFPDNTILIESTLLSVSELSFTIFLIVSPFAQISKILNPYELLQTLPNKLSWIGIIIISFARYFVVSKQQFIQTKLSFRYRNITIVTVIPQFVTTLIHNIMNHSQKFSDNVEIRNLDSPKLLYDKPTYSVSDFILFGLYVLLLVIGIYYVFYLKDFAKQMVLL